MGVTIQAFAWAYLNDKHSTTEHLVVYWTAPIVGTFIAALVFAAFVQPKAEKPVAKSKPVRDVAKKTKVAKTTKEAKKTNEAKEAKANSTKVEVAKVKAKARVEKKED